MLQTDFNKEVWSQYDREFRADINNDEVSNIGTEFLNISVEPVGIYLDEIRKFRSQRQGVVTCYMLQPSSCSNCGCIRNHEGKEHFH